MEGRSVMKAKLGTVWNDQAQRLVALLIEKTGATAEQITTVPAERAGVELMIDAPAKTARAAVWFTEGWIAAQGLSAWHA